MQILSAVTLVTTLMILAHQFGATQTQLGSAGLSISGMSLLYLAVPGLLTLASVIMLAALVWLAIEILMYPRPEEARIKLFSVLVSAGARQTEFAIVAVG